MVAIEQSVEFPHGGYRARILRADDDAVEFHEVTDRGPSLRNSGLVTTSNSMAAPPRYFSVSCIYAATLSPAPTGTVDLSTTILNSFMCSAFNSVTPSTY